MEDREQQIRDAKLADSLILTASQWRSEAEGLDERAARVMETCAAHVEAQVDDYRSQASDPYGPDWEQVAHGLASALEGKADPSLALTEYRRQAGLSGD